MPLYGNPRTTGVERTFHPDEIIVSKTDTSGKITYGNRTFYRLAGLDEEDCLGTQHNLIRHPDMPRTVFEFLWAGLKRQEEVFAYVNNRSANGDNYWVLAHVTPSFGRDGEVIGYHSNRRCPDKRVVEAHVAPLYRELLATEKSGDGPRDGLEKGCKRLSDLLAEKRVGLNELTLSLGH